MKNYYIKLFATILLVALITPLGYSQIQHQGYFKKRNNAPFRALTKAKSKTPRYADDEIPVNTILTEDFSLWTAGTNDAPDTEKLGGSEVGYAIPNELTSTEGWMGNGIYQAGGSCLIGTYVNYYDETCYGFLQTPEMEMFGEIVLTFKAKTLKADNGYLRVALCDNYEGPVDDRDFTITNEWVTYEFATDQATFTPNNIFQFSADGEKILLDDVKITRKRNRIPTPNVLAPENISATSFKAKWEATESAKSYILNIYRKEMPENAIPKTTITEGFDGINVKSDGKTIDTANPNYPANWTIDVSSNGTKDVCTDEGNYNSGKLALNFDAEGDVVITPTTPAPITSIRFWVKPTSMALEADWTYTLLQISVYTEKSGWNAIANIYNQWMTAEGGYYGFDSEGIGEDVTRVKFEIIQKNTVSFAIDDIQIEYQSQPVPVDQLTEELTETSYIYDKVDPQYEYFYNVSARDGALSSAPSPDMWVDGIIGVKPTVKDATNVTANSFTANWEGLHNAGYYKVNTYKVITATTDQKDVVVLHEDFNNITNGTLDNPEILYETQINLADKGLSDNDWVLQLPQMVNGMAGAREPNFWMGIAGLVATPKIDLNCNNGAFDVDFTIYNTAPGDTVFVMIMKELTDSEASDARKFGLKKDAAGSTTGSVHFEGGYDASLRNNIIIAFMSMLGEPFYVDEVTIRQDMKAGEKMIAPYKSYQSENNSLDVTDLPEGNDYAYEVTAIRSRYYDVYTSDKSDRCCVKLAAPSGVNSIDAQSSVTVANGQINISATADCKISLYDLQGRCVKKGSYSAGVHTFNVSPSLYIIDINGKTSKVLVP